MMDSVSTEARWVYEDVHKANIQELPTLSHSEAAIRTETVEKVVRTLNNLFCSLLSKLVLAQADIDELDSELAESRA